MKLLKISCLIFLVLALSIGTLYAAPKNKGEKGKRGHQNIERKNVPSPPGHQLKGNRGKKLGLKKRNSISQKQGQKNITSHMPTRQNNMSKNATNEKHLLRDLRRALNKLENGRWSYNPNDDRGQGNMGNVDMLAPFGHDKDSDRMELYGNRGRVIKEAEPQPEPPPQPKPPPEPEPEPEPEPPPDPDPVPFIVVPY